MLCQKKQEMGLGVRDWSQTSRSGCMLSKEKNYKGIQKDATQRRSSRKQEAQPATILLNIRKSTA